MNALGWLPDHPDRRDFTRRHPRVRDLLAQTRFGAAGLRPPIVDLREGCSPIENQLAIGSCTAHAAAGVVEFMEQRAFGQYADASRLFLYKKTRDLMGLTGDTGATLRDTMRALAQFGAPPEPLWPYDVARFDEEPPAEVVETATHYSALDYLRLDPPNTPLPAVLDAIRDAVASGLPAMFGFTVYRSLWDRRDGGIPYPSDGDSVAGGHAICAVGLDDAIEILAADNRTVTRGALLIRNSWGAEWGDAGYGWLPYQYVLDGLAADFWCVLKQAWVATGAFR